MWFGGKGDSLGNRRPEPGRSHFQWPPCVKLSIFVKWGHCIEWFFKKSSQLKLYNGFLSTKNIKQKEVCRLYWVSPVKKKNKQKNQKRYSKARGETLIEFGKFYSIYNVGIWVQCLSFFLFLCKAHCVLLILGSVHTQALGKKKSKNKNRKNNASIISSGESTGFLSASPTFSQTWLAYQCVVFLCKSC